MKTNKSRLIGLGDSIIKGIVVNRTDNRYQYSLTESTIAELCSKELSIPSKSYGKVACTISEGSDMLNLHIKELQPGDIVILEYGGNDSNYRWKEIALNPKATHEPVTPLSTFANTYRDIIKRIMYTGAMPVVLSLPPIDGERYFTWLGADMSEAEKANIHTWLEGTTTNINNGHELYNLGTMQIAHQMLVPWIDITSVFLMQRNYRDYLCEDGLHPNEKGQKLIAKAIIKRLKYAV